MARIADLVNALFESRLKADGTKYTDGDIERLTHGKLRKGYMWKLRNNDIPNPGRNTLLLLCRVFDVKIDYFFPELQEEHKTGKERLTDGQLDAVLAKSVRLKPDARKHIAAIIRMLEAQQAEDLHNARGNVSESEE